jgi:hypothetical protein
MLVLDQKYRTDTRANPIAKIADSLRILNNSKEIENYIEEAFNIYEKTITIKNIKFKGYLDESIADTLNALQTKIDSQQVLKYIDIIENSPKKFTDTSTCFKSSLIIMAHCPTSMLEKCFRTMHTNKDRYSIKEFNYVMKALEFRE